VPALRKAVIAESRNVVRIDTKKAQYKDDRVTVNVSFNIEEAEVEPSAESTTREKISEEEFWSSIRKQSSRVHDLAKELVSFADKLGLSRRCGSGSLIFDLPLTDGIPAVQQIFFIGQRGKVRVWPETLKRQFNRSGLQMDTSTYRSAVVKAFRVATDRQEPSCRLGDFDLETFKKAVSDFVAEIKIKKED
jgi:hypothetical protein